jgi:hypothetical protein
MIAMVSHQMAFCEKRVNLVNAYNDGLGFLGRITLENQQTGQPNLAAD